MAGGIERLHVKGIQSWIKSERARLLERTPDGNPVLASKNFDGHGLFLTLTPAGTPVWRLRYRFGINANGTARDRILSIGEFPEVGLAEARAARDAARSLLRENIDPVVQRRTDRATRGATGDTFRACAAEWLAAEKLGWKDSSEKTAREQIERHVSKWIGDLPIQAIDAPVFASVLKRLIDPKAEKGIRVDTAQKISFWCTKIFDTATAMGKFRGDNPVRAAAVLIPRKKKSGRRAALLTWSELGEILRRAETAHLSPTVRMAHRLCAFTAARPGNVIAAEWSEFDLTGATFTLQSDAATSQTVVTPRWLISREKMKAQDRHEDHVLFLGPTITAELLQWQALNGSPTKGYLFPSLGGSVESSRHKDHITSEALSKAYRETMGYAKRHSPHGWRAAFASLAREQGHPDAVVEMALDHIHGSRVVVAYDRWQRLLERIRLASWWNDQLSTAERGTT